MERPNGEPWRSEGDGCKVKLSMIGKTLKHYQVVEKLGEGGMGVVWKARDTHLDRFVALKVLPREKVADAERMRRFVQEAKSASALNHPNIIHIYDIAEAEGVPFIAMEYVPGKTLDQLISRKGLRLGDALRHAVQIADALAKAHSAGILHRDLKPSNIMVSGDGLVKVLDFGLAKLTQPAGGEFEATQAADRHDTEEGAIVGTVPYMSPEQAEGKNLDARSDIFSFGSLLYEMITGRRAFHRDSKLSTLSAILKEDPKPVTMVAPDVPRDVEKVITRCLRKDPDRRFQHADDLKIALLELKEESDSGTLTASAGASTGRRRHHRLAWAAGLLLCFLAASLSIRVWLRARGPRATARATPLTSYPGWQGAPALSPDGRQVAFSWDGEKGENRDIYVKLVDAGAPLRLTTNPATDASPAWSPDGRYIAFLRYSETGSDVFMVPALGGAERRLGHIDVLFGSLAWSPDGRFLAAPDRSNSNETTGIYLLSLETGEKRRLTSPPPGFDGDYAPAFSPGGEFLAFVRMPSPGNGDIYVAPLGSGSTAAAEPRRLTFDERWILGLDWTPDGRHLVFSSDRSGSMAIWAVPGSGGNPERLAVAGENSWALSVSRTGNRLAYQRVNYDPNIWRVPGPSASARRDRPVKLIASTREDGEPQISPDGRKIVFASRRSGSLEIWIADSDGNSPVQLTSLRGPPAGSPRWSPDSRWIAFDAPVAGKVDTFVIGADGGAPRRLTSDASNNVRPSWSSDGRWVYFGSNRSGDWQVWKAPASGGPAVQVTKGGGYEAFESRDGKFIYYSKSPPSTGIWRVAAEGGEETPVLDKGATSIWALTRDGICFFDWKGPEPASPVLQFHRFLSDHSTVLYEFPRGTRVDTGGTSISVSPDGQWILYTQIDQAGSDLVLVENFR